MSPSHSPIIHVTLDDMRRHWQIISPTKKSLTVERALASRRMLAARDAREIEIVDYHQGWTIMAPVVHPGRLLKRELTARRLSANRLSLDIGVPSGRVTDILNGRRSITADTAVRLGRYFGNGAQFWLDLQGQYDIGVVEREKGAEIAKRVRPADAA